MFKLPTLHTAYRAARLIPFLEPGCGSGLLAPVAILANATLLVGNGRIVKIGRNLSLPANCMVHDLGNVTIAPPLVNCHTHLQLSWLRAKTVFGAGFTQWLKSLVPHILGFLASGSPCDFQMAISKACHELAASGCGMVADTGGSLPGGLTVVDRAAAENHVAIRHFCEWFGFGTAASCWPDRCANELASRPDLATRCAPAGHALYSTSPERMIASHAWCKHHNRKFSFHLAESPEEQELLLAGTGALADFYTPEVLPENWQAPGLTSFRYAEKLGLIDSHTIAVHGVWLEKDEVRDFGKNGANLCLCPRSNRNIGTGTAPLRELLAANVPLCLGTDGLSSCDDLDLRKEAALLRPELPLQGLLRLACANGAAALGLPLPALVPGAQARFSIWPDEDFGGTKFDTMQFSQYPAS